MKKIFPLLVFLACNLTVWGQADTVFWFAAPDMPNNIDRPITLNITSASDFPSIVTIAEPANSSFTPMIITLNPNQIQQVDLTPYIGQIENRSYDIISNYGLKITATYPIMVEYEISSSYSSVYNLKGKSALGLEFYTPIPPTNQSTRSFEIVATENNSTIIITPYVNTSTHLAGIPFTIVLNQGQTYPLLLETIYWYGDGTNPIGCKIVANKLIAVNIENGDSADQLVPTNLIGNEYIVSTPSIEDGIQAMAGSVMIYAIRNNTQIFCNFYDSLSYVATIGEAIVCTQKVRFEARSCVKKCICVIFAV